MGKLLGERDGRALGFRLDEGVSVGVSLRILGAWLGASETDMDGLSV